jgi:ribosomal protein S12 methylthiotransferase accessory factor
MNRMAHPHRRIVASAACLEALGGHAALADAWDASVDVASGLAQGEGDGFAAGDACLVLFDLRLDPRLAVDVQKRALAAGATLVFVGLEPGTVQIGPVVRPGVAGCLDCVLQRVHSNHPTARQFADNGQRRRPQPQRPLSPVAARVVLDLIATAADTLPVGNVLRVKADSLEISRHRFIAATNCSGCPVERPVSRPQALQFVPRIKRAASDKRVPNPKLSLDSARRVFVDRHSGLVKHVFQNRQSDLMPLFTSERPYPGGKDIDYSHGRASNYQTSELVAILEAVERYAGNELRDGSVALRGSYRQMVAAHGDRVPDPAIYLLHSEQQRANPLFQLEPYHEDLECGWVWGHSMRRNGPVLVPEQLAYYNLRNRPGAPTHRFVYDSSNGCSLGGSLEEATLGGLHEIVERDAYFSTWYSRVPPPRIALDSVDDRRSAALIARSLASGFAVHLFDLTSDARIPVVGAMIVDPAADAMVKSYCASACDGRWSEAIFAALAEVTTSMGVYRKNKDLSVDRARAMFADGSLVQDMYDHVHLYSLPETFARLQFLLDGDACTLGQCQARTPDTIHVDLTRELQAECAKVLQVATDVIVVDQTFPELRELGLCAAKVLAPGLLPVTFGHQYQRVDPARLDRFAQFRGVAGARFSTANINPYPHNFP